ncbi:Crp/Fnr family transcriptional regulator, partial [Saccharothrix xinjiangensis]
MDDLISDSSFGLEDACDLRERTPDEVADALVDRVERRIRKVLHRGVGLSSGASAIAQRAATNSPVEQFMGSLAVATAPQQASGSGSSDLVWPGNTLLGRLRENTRQELLNIGTVVRYTADREVIEQDAKDTHALLLLDGVVKVQTTDETGDTALLAIRSAGDLVGEMAALDQKPRSATVVT